MARHYFGTDGMRGRVGQEPITPDRVLRLGQAAGRVLRRRNGGGRTTVLIGKDTRVSGYMLEACLQAGFSSAGVDIVLCGPLPTPGIAYLTRALRLDAGVVISASHNPYDDNGIKFFSELGTKFPDALEEEIEAEMDRGAECVPSAELGKAVRLDDASGRYIEFCKSTISGSVDLKGLRLLADCANGAAYHIAPDVFHELGAEVTAVGNKPNGFNINDGVGATHTEHLSEWVRKNGCEYGISLDGDADRLIMADADGHVYNGDELLYVIVRDRMQRGRVDGVVGTLMTNFALEKRFAELGVPFVRAKVGDRYVLEQLKERGWLFGGETSGHILILDRQTTGDGIVSALQVFSAMKRSGKSLAELTADLKLLPQTLVNRHIPKGYDWKGDKAFAAAVAGAEKEVAGRGRVLVRPSGTEPVLRIMVEADDPALAQRLAERTAESLSV
ncbi:MAG: Phosphoglucosamine mutase [Burkholderia sp.]|jgi:phosphoglucosamine mutase